MDPRLLKHYEGELTFLREMGAEFAGAYPKIASRLGMEGLEVQDPYVERLLEGAAFLSARVQLELALQYPAFTSHLLEIVHPHFLAPVPSMMIVAFQPDPAEGALADGAVLRRHTNLRSVTPAGQQTACTYRTAADLTLWPIEIADCEYLETRGALAAAGLSPARSVRAGLRLRLCRTDGAPMADLPLDRLSLFVSNAAGHGARLHEWLCTAVVELAARSAAPSKDWTLSLPEGALAPKGFEPDEALLPCPRPSFDGYRLLQEYFALPERFHFVELTGLRSGLARAPEPEVDIFLLLDEDRQALGREVTTNSFQLHSVPAINLFPKRFDRVPLRSTDTEHHIVPNRIAPNDFEVYALDGMTGIGSRNADDTMFRPFFAPDELTPLGDRHAAYFTIRRRLRQRSARERLKGARTSYLGSDVFVSLVDGAEAPYRADLTQLAPSGLCTNRDLPLLLASGGEGMFHLPDGGPVVAVRTPVSPTRPLPTLAQGETAWRLISHLSLNYLSIADTEAGDGASALRELLGLYAPLANRAYQRQIDGLTGVRTRPLVRRMTDEVLSSAVRGLEVSVVFDEDYFEGANAYTLAAVLERFFRKYVTLNSFTETVFETQQRGEVARWRPESGLGHLI